MERPVSRWWLCARLDTTRCRCVGTVDDYFEMMLVLIVVGMVHRLDVVKSEQCKSRCGLMHRETPLSPLGAALPRRIEIERVPVCQPA